MSETIGKYFQEYEQMSERLRVLNDSLTLKTNLIFYINSRIKFDISYWNELEFRKWIKERIIQKTCLGNKGNSDLDLKY